jgi:coatomer protein complex subunit gamma
MTKLFQCEHTNLRKMMYLVIKGMAPIADDVIIVTSSLTKDMTGKNENYRAGAIRALTQITDVCRASSLPQTPTTFAIFCWSLLGSGLFSN